MEKEIVSDYSEITWLQSYKVLLYSPSLLGA